MTIRIWILSDLHIDGTPWTPERLPEHDVCIVAGDVRDGLVRSIGWLAEHIVPRSPSVIYTPGNHDFYNSRWQSELARGRDAAAAAGISLLAVGEVIHRDGVRLVGATLWTDYGVQGEPWRAISMAAAGDRLGGMRDHRRIKRRLLNGETNSFRPQDAAIVHADQLGRIRRVLAEPHEGPTVVVTHHAPHPRSLLHGYPTVAIDGAYASDLTRDLEGPGAPDLWIHGHIHASRDYTVGGTRIIANPRGHPGENLGFDPGLVVTL
ncbi:MAG: metallophosphoesterase [Parafilimonas terrae]|nr:metallophosphoesterase [Parafilimonas terrae]